MKKALIVLLILAVAGGLFAQGWTFSGYMNGGLGIQFDSKHDPTTYVSSSNAQVGDGGRLHFISNYVNPNKNAGIYLRLRADGKATGGSNNGSSIFSPGVNSAFAWVTALDGMIWVAGGKFDNAGGPQGNFTTMDRMYAYTHGEGTGIYTIVKPIDVLEVGVAGFRGNNASMYKNTMVLGNVAVTVPNTVKILAGMRNRSGIVASSNSVWTGKNTTVSGDERNNRSAAWLSGSYLGMKELHAAVTMRMFNYEKFNDYGYMEFMETFGWTGIENLNLNFGARETLFAGKKAKAGVTKSDMALWLWFWASYALNDGAIVPRLDVNYVSGASWGGTVNFTNGAVAPAFTNSGARIPMRDSIYIWDNKVSFMNLRLSNQFRISSTAYVEVGYQTWLGIGKGYKDLTKINSQLEKMEHAVYADVTVSF